ncbi:uncharacterized protein LOC143576224 [Bidens hawaiensis]|uniref:uncharacterized protein LOC143576224 n=1 Tax=Bidens hawaiensis TaxID=980011 RepID=UPI0040490E65
MAKVHQRSLPSYHIHVKEEPTPILLEHCPRGNTKISFLHGTTGLRKKPVLELCYKGHSFGYMLLGSCNGLILVCNDHPTTEGMYRFALINPLKKECCDLPPIPTKTIGLTGSCGSYYWASGIGNLDDSTNTLKTVFFANVDPEAHVPCTMVRSSGSSSWREVAQKPAYPIKGRGVFAHGRLYWLSYPFDTFSISVTDRRMLVWFDVKIEEFGLTDPPKPEEGGRWADYNELVVLNGQLGFSYYGPFGIKIWVLKQHEEWVLHCCFDTRPILPPPLYDEYDNLEILGCWNNDGDILLRSYDSGDRLLVYTLKSGDLREVDRGDDACGGWIRVYQSSSLLLLPTSD